MKEKKRTTGIDWRVAKARIHGLSDEEQRILGLLAAGRTQAEIGKELGIDRSAVWRRVNKLRRRVREEP